MREIINWYKINLRDLPWRSTQNAYFIWLSEIILQQTRVDQGMPYYYKFIERFPTVKDLAEAKEEEVLKLWEGLGYYSRARNLHVAAKTIHELKNGHFPSVYEEIRALKGVGDYTAAAIASLAFNLPHAVVDGNVYRVLSRYFGITTPIDTTAGKKEFFALANNLIDKDQPGLFNQAMMEFGAMHCTPKQPLCESCPVQANCVAYHKGMVEDLPVKSKKVQVKDRFFNYLVLEHEDTIYIERRGVGDIWAGLYQFPLVETDARLKDGELPDLPSWLEPSNFVLMGVSGEYKHILTHRRLFAKFYRIKLNKKPRNNNLTAVEKDELSTFAFPKLILRYFDEEF